MEMSAAYMDETAQVLSRNGFVLTVEQASYGDGRGTRYVLERGPAIRLVMETVHHPEAEERYYLAIDRWFGMRTYSYPLDSWKHFPDRVELKFEPHPDTSLGPSLILDFELIPGASTKPPTG